MSQHLFLPLETHYSLLFCSRSRLRSPVISAHKKMSESDGWDEDSGSERWSDSEAQDPAGPPAAERWSSGSSDSSGEEDSAAVAARELVSFLLSLNFAGQLSARTLCTICWWVRRTGCSSQEVARLALNPASQSGKFQRRIDAALGLSAEKESSYRISVPGYTKHGVTRQDLTTAVEVPYEQLLEEIAANPTFEDELHNAVETKQLPPSYFDHEVYQASVTAGDASYPVPIGLFIDGVSYLKKASFIALWTFCLITGVRHVVWILKKDELCNCGCSGWCSLYKAFDYTQWALNCAARGVFPLRRHDNTPWPAGDARGLLAGKQMGYKFALIWLKADWGEFANSIGFHSWSSKHWPCYCCCAEQASIRSVEPSFSSELPWAPITQEDYNASCTACEIDVVVPNRETHAAIRAALYFDRRRNGSRGRALQRDVEVGGVWLRSGDRLEVSPYLDNTFAFDAVRSFPFTVRFWRRNAETIVARRNPIFMVTGFDVGRLVVDTLHCLYLGVVQVWLVASLWALINADAWGAGDVVLSIQQIKAGLKVYYRQRGGRDTRVQNITAKMLGTKNDPARSPFKGGEAKSLVDFVVELLGRYAHVSGDLLLAGRHLQAYIQLVDASPVNLSESVIKKMRTHGVSFLSFGLRGGMRPIPKTHQMLHLLHECSARHGNPKFYSNWVDESLNKNLAGMARAAYSSVWADRIFICWRRLRESRGRGLTIG